jgi:protein-S-isoprenylcysteine O-methyltransferase Ste14
MKYLLITVLSTFYFFFFIRAFVLSKSLGKSIKGKNPIVNFSILSSGVSSLIFIAYLIYPEIENYFYIIFSSIILKIIGSIIIISGILLSVLSSISLKKSWRIGVDENEKTELISSGIYRISRNPYFLSFDLVLIGMVLYFLAPVLIITVLATVILFHVIILNEEKYLEKTHGNNYKKYKERVRRYL